MRPKEVIDIKTLNTVSETELRLTVIQIMNKYRNSWMKEVVLLQIITET